MEQKRAWRGPAVLSGGYRPFFPLAAALAAIAMAFWMASMETGSAAPSGMDPIAWHVHELVYGYVPAVLAGFLLTAVPNWTGRLPVVGWPLAGLVGVWLLGRAAIVLSAHFPPPVLAAAAIAFPLLLIVYLGREILAAGNRRNLVVLALLAIYTAGLALAHVELWRGGAFEYGHRISIATVVFLLALIGGRITLSFTTNWLKKRGARALPAPFGLVDRIALAASLPALVLWAAALDQHWSFAPAAGLAALLQFVRLARWRAWATGPEPLLLMLHVSYAFIPIGFALLAVAALDAAPLTPSAGLHAWTVGGVGGMTLAVMMRATLGHSGRALAATPAAKVIFSLIMAAALARVAAEFGLAPRVALLIAAMSWIASMAVFALAFGRISVVK